MKITIHPAGKIPYQIFVDCLYSQISEYCSSYQNDFFSLHLKNFTPRCLRVQKQFYFYDDFFNHTYFCEQTSINIAIEVKPLSGLDLELASWLALLSELRTKNYIIKRHSEIAHEIKQKMPTRIQHELLERKLFLKDYFTIVHRSKRRA